MLLLLSTLLPTATSLHTYLGPTHCNKQGHTATSVTIKFKRIFIFQSSII